LVPGRRPLLPLDRSPSLPDAQHYGDTQAGPGAGAGVPKAGPSQMACFAAEFIVCRSGRAYPFRAHAWETPLKKLSAARSGLESRKPFAVNVAMRENNDLYNTATHGERSWPHEARTPGRTPR